MYMVKEEEEEKEEKEEEKDEEDVRENMYGKRRKRVFV